ncbi:MAG: SCO family protein [Luteolibacter sp.]
MNSKGKLVVIYGAVAVISAVILGTAMWLRQGVKGNPSGALVVNAGKATEEKWIPIEKDIEGVNQLGEKVKLSDLKGKVVLVAEFFAVCPHCAQRNGVELKAIYDAFGSNPDFRIVCISVDPTNDTPEQLSGYASAYGADAKNWWFFNAGDEKKVHEYLERELKFMGIRERRDPADIESNGRFAHDLAFQLVDRDWQIVGKWPLADARSEEAMQRQPELYEQLKTQLYGRIRTELSKAPQTVER